MTCFATIKGSVCGACTFLSLSALFLVSLCVLGCSESRNNSLINRLRTQDVGRIISIDQLALSTRDGLPKPIAVQSARVIKSVQTQGGIESFCRALVTAKDGVRFANHPVVVGDITLRVDTTMGTWFLFIRVVIRNGVKSCTVKSGENGETNINRMKAYESDLLAIWLGENQIEPR